MMVALVLIFCHVSVFYFLCSLWAALTVRENIRFAAELYLPSSVSAEEREERVTTVIEELGLTSCADTVYVVGNEGRRMKWASLEQSS